MQNLSALRELTQKLNEIKETWQIYAIFEEARESFNKEFNALKKDKEALIKSFNDTSAKNALLLAQNKELEAKNKALIESNKTLEDKGLKTQGVVQKKLQDSIELDSNVFMESKTKDFTSLYMQCEGLQETLKTIQAIFAKVPHTAPKPLTKLEVSYQKHQRLLANPAEDYVHLKSAKELFDALINAESKLKTLDLDLAKLQIEMRDLLQETQTTNRAISPQEISKQETSKSDSLNSNPQETLATTTLMQDSIILDSTNNNKP
ncbi:hypothetical protein [Helicobacter turcicus]|uniref:Uncharacterized protein n=1 Tax=Helicobacter turcicus TaxID=2867412 RepID=A0ABS7JNB0_9HELI|nr:hypothetical protein [Helicobacter turcicus]MBX7490899.1 hypothetical protein [Helicobacter turcicus]MBX7545753.1 hypothetical protein [Helicobacter turcicus]